MTRLLARYEDELLSHVASGADIDPARITPRVVLVSSEQDALLFRYAALHWSVPVTGGYGRRTRFLLIDESNDKLIGIFALSDPVYNLRARDQEIAWSDERKRDALYRVLDASVIGAVQPYSQLLGGKLIALAAISRQALDVIEEKYRGTTTAIRQRALHDHRPVLVTTTSALGRSSIYNRLRRGDRWYYRSIGWTEGYGHFELPPTLFTQLVALLDEAGNPISKANQYGDGPNWKFRVIRVGLEYLGLPGNLALFHGIAREVFIAPTAANWVEVLQGHASAPTWHADDLDELADFFRIRWAIPRATRTPDYRLFRPEDYRLLGLTSGLAQATQDDAAPASVNAVATVLWPDSD